MANSLKSEVKSFIKNYLAKQNVTQGLTQAQHTGILVGLIRELVFPEATKDEAKELFALLYPLVNGSALRQTLEKEKILTPKGAKRGANADDLASKYVDDLEDDEPSEEEIVPE